MGGEGRKIKDQTIESKTAREMGVWTVLLPKSSQTLPISLQGWGCPDKRRKCVTGLEPWKQGWGCPDKRRNCVPGPCKRRSECYSFRFVASKSWRKNPQQVHWASLLVPFIQQYLFTLDFVSHFGNSHNISNFFIFLMLVKSESQSCSVVSDSLRPLLMNTSLDL